MEWTPELTERVRQLWEAGGSAATIAAEIGNGATRNSIIGKAHREQWPYKGKARSHTPRPDPPPPPPAPPPPPPPLPPIEDLVEPIGQRLPLVELADGRCKWPLNDPPRGGEYLFCGEPTWPGERSYCGYHLRIGTARSSARQFRPGAWR